VFEVADRTTILSHGEKVGDFPICDVTQDDVAAMVMGQGIPEHL
jgi:ABC-type sugar transport system ATPase subunit